MYSLIVVVIICYYLFSPEKKAETKRERHRREYEEACDFHPLCGAFYMPDDLDD